MSKTFNDTGMGRIIAWISAHVFKKSDAVATQVLGIDSSPTNNSSNLVSSGGVYDALSSKYEKPISGIPASDIASGVIPDVSNVVRTSSQSFTDAQKLQARQNIDADAFVVEILVSLSGLSTSVTYQEVVAAINARKDIYFNMLSVYMTVNSATFGSESAVLEAYGIAEGSVSDLDGFILTVRVFSNGDPAEVTSTNQSLGTYSKPSGGIPASDIASGVIPNVPVQDVTVGGTSVLNNGIAVIPSIPNDNDLVHKTGDETIAGNKTFINDIIVDDGNASPATGISNIKISGTHVSGSPVHLDVNINGYTNDALEEDFRWIRYKGTFRSEMPRPNDEDLIYTKTLQQALDERNNVITTIKVNNSALTPDSNKAVNITVPDVSNFITNSVNNLTNYYLKSETYTKTEVDTLIGAINQFRYEIAATTSAVSSPESNVLYLIGPTGSGSDKYEEYVYANNTWTKIGDTSIDLSGYVTTQALNTALANYTTTTDLTTLLSGKANTATTLAGYGITDANISNGVITLGSNTITPLTSFTETDPTVPAWAKASNKPTYNYSEIVDAPTIESLTTSEIDTIWNSAS